MEGAAEKQWGETEVERKRDVFMLHMTKVTLGWLWARSNMGEMARMSWVCMEGMVERGQRTGGVVVLRWDTR